jgi:hypothetical protein
VIQINAIEVDDLLASQDQIALFWIKSPFSGHSFVLGSDRPFLVLDLYLRSPESGNV